MHCRVGSACRGAAVRAFADHLMSLIAVIDFETTGKRVGGSNRVVEIGVVLMDFSGKQKDEFCSLVNPQRDVGPTWIHRIRASDVLHAPRFADVAGEVSELLSRATVVAGHNVAFDLGFLRSEYARIGIKTPDYQVACTKAASGGISLKDACHRFDVAYDETRSHSALYDALRSADILRKTAIREGSLASVSTKRPASMPVLKLPRLPALKRSDVPTVCSNPAGFFSVLQAAAWQDLKRLGRDGHQREYVRGLVDTLSDGSPFAELRLSDEILRASSDHRDTLNASIVGACATWAQAYGRTATADTAAMSRLCDLLAVDKSTARKRSRSLEAVRPPAIPTLDSLRGKEVCFSGDTCMQYAGEPLTPEVGASLCGQVGIRYTRTFGADSVSLVAEDVMSLSSKAFTARKRRIPIVAEKDFWGLVCKGVTPRHGK